MSSIPPVRPIRVIGMANKDGQVVPTREFLIWLELQQRAVETTQTSNTLNPVSGGIDLVAVIAGSSVNAPVPMESATYSDLGPVFGGCCDFPALEPV